MYIHQYYSNAVISVQQETAVASEFFTQYSATEVLIAMFRYDKHQAMTYYFCAMW